MLLFFHRVVIGFAEGIVMVKIGREEPTASMDISGKVVWIKHKKIQTADISVESDHEVSSFPNGSILLL